MIIMLPASEFVSTQMRIRRERENRMRRMCKKSLGGTFSTGPIRDLFSHLYDVNAESNYR